MLRFLAPLVVITSVLALSSLQGYEGYKIYEVIPSTSAQCDLLYELSQKDENSYDFLTLSRLPENTARVLVTPQAEQELLQYLVQHQMKFHVLNENVGQTIERDFAVDRLLRSRAAPFAGKGRLSTERYYSHAEINNYIDDLGVRYPNRVFIKLVGKSYERRLMKTITITNGDGRANKNVIFVDGGFHAREWISPAAVLYMIEQLTEHYHENADLLLDYDWVIFPVVNPDGYEFSRSSTKERMWRKTRTPNRYLGRTCHGTDPNRNFDIHWNEKGASSIPCMDTYAGPKPFSEAETIILRDLLLSLKERGILYLTIHSHGNYLLYPWGWTDDLPDTWEELDEVARIGSDAIKNATGTVYTVGSTTTVLYTASGGSDDYAFQIGFPMSFTMELTCGGTTCFDPPPSSIDPFVKETWIGVHAMAKKVVEKYPLGAAVKHKV